MNKHDMLTQGAGTVMMGSAKPELCAPSGCFAVTDTMGRVTVKSGFNEYETLPWAMVVAKGNRSSVGTSGVDDLPTDTKFYAWDGAALHDMDEGAARRIAKANEQARADIETLLSYRGDRNLYGSG